MTTVICPKCKQPIIAIDKDYVICCDEVIYVPIVQRIELEFPKL